MSEIIKLKQVGFRVLLKVDLYKSFKICTVIGSRFQTGALNWLAFKSLSLSQKEGKSVKTNVLFDK